MRLGGERITKVFLDSRYALPDGSLQIPGGGVLLDPDNRCWLGEFSTVASWGTIDATNNILYVQEQTTGAPNNRAIALPTGPHDMDSLATAMQTGLSGDGKAPAFGTYTVTRVTTGSGGATSRVYNVSCSVGSFFRLPSEWQIRVTWFASKADAVTNSTNGLFTFPQGSLFWNSSLTSGFVDLRRVHSIFIHAPGFGNNNTVGPRGSRSILAKVPVDVGYGGAIHWRVSGSEHDSAELGVHSMTVLTVELRDVAGNLIDLKGAHWSCTLLFDK